MYVSRYSQQHRIYLSIHPSSQFVRSIQVNTTQRRRRHHHHHRRRQKTTSTNHHRCLQLPWYGTILQPNQPTNQTIHSPVKT